MELQCLRVVTVDRLDADSHRDRWTLEINKAAKPEVIISRVAKKMRYSNHHVYIFGVTQLSSRLPTTLTDL
jgi:hypothetical protein